MNELDKTIDDCLKSADEYDELAISYREIEDNYVRILGTQYKPDYSTSKECTVSASKNRQLAEWLRELKELRKNKIGIYGRADAIGVGCANCIYLKTEDYTKRPCGICCFNYSSKFEEVNADE